MMEIESTYASPSPLYTPYRTPSSSRSRQTSRGGFDDMSPASTPPPLPSSEERNLSRASKRLSGDVTNHQNQDVDETLPLTDPRRFTPNLHASLVSEILSLRRDVEVKTKNIDHLEQSLHSAQAQNESLNANLLSANKEVRQVKRQMHILEGGTLSAINELAKERDNALSETNEIRSRLEQAQRKAKAHEGTLDHTQEQWQKDKESWATEKRALETKIHVIEGRLKVVLSEVAKTHQASQEEVPGSPTRAQSRMSILESPQKFTRGRRQSANSISSDHAGGRASVMSTGHHGFAVNLAEELNALDDIGEDSASEDDDHNGRISPDALPEENPRPTSRLSIKAKKILGLPIDLDEVDQSNSRPQADIPSNVHRNNVTKELDQPKYVDTGIQYSRPSTPVKQWRPPTTDSSMFNFLRSPDDTPRNSKAFSVNSPTSASFSDDTADANWEATLRNQPIMVSSSCQTVEQMPSPPMTPKDDLMLATIHESIETREIAVQTEPMTESHSEKSENRELASNMTYNRSVTLDIPTIEIIPPASRPTTPAENHVQLPPRTKTVGCQVEIAAVNQYVSTSMQTEQIHVDKRNLIALPPLPSSNTQTQSIFTKSKPVGYIRRGNQHAANSSMRRMVPNQSSALPPIEDGSPDEGSGADEVPPMPQFHQMLTYEDIMMEEMADMADDDVFHEDDFLSRPTAKFTLQRGKMISQEKSRDDVFDSEAALIGERLALENIRQSEDGLPSFIIPGSERARAQAQIQAMSSNSKQPKRTSSSRSNSIRRTALISSGTAAHQSKNSQSSMGSSDTAAKPPPMPIPVRYSSARVIKASSEGGRNSRGSSTASPTKNMRRITKPQLRKTRSGPALSPAAQAARRERSKSPPLPSPRVSIVPEMPSFQMPTMFPTPTMAMSFHSGASYDASAPRPSIATGPSRKSHHTKQTSDALSIQQTSVVDAIAQTMVGEWMYKYVRRRKSFGKPEKDWDPNKSVDELANATTTGVRHKRWVWLAPYERSVMWSSKQPQDGTALMGKSGRKLTIKSVLDVKDDNPMPKGSIKGPHFNRSILILTSQRALKFTAITQDRHFIWLTALSFLSHSPISLNDLAPIPPVPTDDQTIRSRSSAASLGGSFRRRPIRDSIRIAKVGKKGASEFTSFDAENLPVVEYDQNGPGTHAYYDPNQDAALPPTIKRFHSRTRSNTAPRPPPSSFSRMLGKDSGTHPPATAYSNSGGPSDRGSLERSIITPSEGTPTFPSTRRGSEASATSRPVLPGPSFLESTLNSSHASMTMRMEAFIERQTGKLPLRSMKSGPQLPQVGKGGPSFQQFRKDLSQWGSEDSSRPSFSPVESLMPESVRQSDGSMGRVSSDRDWFKSF